MLLSICPEIPGHTLHVTQRGHLHAACFFSSGDRSAYLGWLDGYARHTGCAVHAYVLMGNHVHLLLTPSRTGGVAELMRLLTERYARHVVETWQRAVLHEGWCDGSPAAQGHDAQAVQRYTAQAGQSDIAQAGQRDIALWEKGFSATPVHINRYVLACMRYIELNPVRARMARSPEQFLWSSHRCHAYGEENRLLTPHAAYAALGRSATTRQSAYQAFCRNVRPGGATQRGPGYQGKPAFKR